MIALILIALLMDIVWPENVSVQRDGKVQIVLNQMKQHVVFLIVLDTEPLMHNHNNVFVKENILELIVHKV